MLDMWPKLALLNTANSLLANTISRCQFSLQYSAGQCADFLNGCFREFAGRIHFPKLPWPTASFTQFHTVSMALVFARRGPFQIVHTIIRLRTILMVNLITGRNGAKKGMSNELMNSRVMLDSESTQDDSGITFGVQSNHKNAANPSTMSTGHTSYPPQARYFISAFVADDGPPIFDFQGHGDLCRLGVHRETPSRCHAAGGPRLAAAIIIARGTQRVR